MSDFEAILNELQKAVEDFNTSMISVQENVLNDVQVALKDLEVINGSVSNSVANLQKIENLKNTIERAILNDGYQSAVVDLGGAFDKISELQNKYFSSLVDNFSAPEVLAEIKNLAIDNVVTDLTESGLDSGVTNKIRDILKVNIESGAKYKDLVKELDTFLTDTPAGEGILRKYTGQVVTDSLNQFSALYKNTYRRSGLEWFRYVGALVGGSRALCIKH
jgi:cysteinyl-tRNA synthetase